jgi:hypothetical protein
VGGRLHSLYGVMSQLGFPVAVRRAVQLLFLFASAIKAKLHEINTQSRLSLSFVVHWETHRTIEVYQIRTLGRVPYLKKKKLGLCSSITDALPYLQCYLNILDFKTNILHYMFRPIWPSPRAISSMIQKLFCSSAMDLVSVC